MKGKVVKASCAFALSACLAIAGTQVAYAGWEANSGTTLHSPVKIEAWAWVNAWGSTQGKAFAQVGSAKSDTGWFRKATRTARAYGSPSANPIKHDYYIK